MKILSLDLGSKTGWACQFTDGRRESGVQDFSLKRGESPGMRYIRFNAWLVELIGLGRPELIVYEMPHHRGGAATEILNGLATRVQEHCARFKIDHHAVHSATLKKWATGSGRASKEDMIKEFEKRTGKKPISDDEADAYMLLLLAMDEFHAL